MRTCLEMRLLLMTLMLSGGFALPLAHADGNQCSTVFSSRVTLPQQFVLKSEIQENIGKTIHELAQLRLTLDLAQVNGASTVELSALSRDYQIKKSKFIEYLEGHSLMTRDQLSAKIRQEIETLQAKKREESKIEKEQRSKQVQQIDSSIIDGTSAVLHRINPGHFKMGDVLWHRDATVEKAFDMMATPTTQIIWKKIVDLAAQKFPGQYQIPADPSRVKGDENPVESVTYGQVSNWLQALNQLSKAGEAQLVKIIPDHKPGDVYRLPTATEWEFVAKSCGQVSDHYHFGNDTSLLGDYAWYGANSGQQTHPVARKNPLIINGKEFYDIHGNVAEMVSTDPELGHFVSYGGGVFSLASQLRSGYTTQVSPNTSSPGIGFRFVRDAE